MNHEGQESKEESEDEKERYEKEFLIRFSTKNVELPTFEG